MLHVGLITLQHVTLTLGLFEVTRLRFKIQNVGDNAYGFVKLSFYL